MRHLHVAAALGLLAGSVLAQYNAFEWMDDLAPRYWHEFAAEPPLLAKRDGDCGDGNHPCSDVNSTVCCLNTQYCVVNSTTWETKCCALGSTCGEFCGTERYWANITTTTTISSSVTVETVAGCAGRTCVSTLYQCPSSMGGGCCEFGSNCGYDSVSSKGLCLSVSSTSTSASALVSEIPSGCSAQGQTYCTTGGGCCDAGYACTLVSSTSPMCSKTTATATTGTGTGSVPTGSGVSVVHESNGLSTGAKAGIAIGVVAAAALVIAAVTWLCIRRRRSARSNTTTTTANELQSNPVRGDGVGVASNDGGIRPYGANSGPHMSEADGHSYGYAPSSTNASRQGPPPQLRGLTGDYFGPEPNAAGAYYAEGQRGQGHPAALANADAANIAGDGDVGSATPVEIGTRDSVRRPPHTRMSSQDSGDGSQSELADTSSANLARGGSLARHEAAASSVRDSIAGRFELYGGDAPTSPGARSGDADVFHDASEGRTGFGGSSGLLPQPLPTPGSEMSEFATPSPMSREEPELQPRREV